MRGALQQAETNLRFYVILSPIDGGVARNVTVGQSVAASLQAPNVFTIAQDLTRMQVYSKTDGPIRERSRSVRKSHFKWTRFQTRFSADV